MEGVKRLFIVKALHKKNVDSQCHLQLLCLTIQAVVYFGGFFPKLGHFAGFSLYIITNAVWIREAAMGGAGDIKLIKKEVKQK